MVINVVWLHSRTQLGGKKGLQFIRSRRSCTVYVPGYFCLSCFVTVLRDLLLSFFQSPRSDPYRLFSLDFLFALVSAGTRSACGKQKNLQ